MTDLLFYFLAIISLSGIYVEKGGIVMVVSLFITGILPRPLNRFLLLGYASWLAYQSMGEFRNNLIVFIVLSILVVVFDEKN
ncbi:hypothetical protein A2572_04090 [Candidatus Collierbacteria bacterium RIFOXYD1_FULL_40_9]|uniref:Uncharacterized protein n=1 Tax=Candidatus Collierbacteria bacterium RIFOXYD1_FULL_40_9 TaxID=1817731 RepID=A0A1F5FPM1_9BACT|nr:MAG: hypothetical protein A2572_04090 [Candidatus Collierbacteria bacterium RIFOXYD1_FULL_40_9]